MADGNNLYFHHAVKERASRNIIDCLMDERGVVVDDPKQIKKLIRDFYLQFLGGVLMN